MAESDGQERTEEPSGKRLSDAREKGQIPRSRELATTVMLLAGATALLVLGHSVIIGLTDIMKEGLSLSREQVFDHRYGLFFLRDSIGEALVTVAPVLGVLVVAAIAGSVALSGWNFSGQAIQFDFTKMSPLKGLKRIVGPQGLMELAKALVKFALLAGAGSMILWSSLPELLGLGREPLPRAIAHGGNIILWAFLSLSMVMVLVAAVDAPFQLWNHKRQLRMTREEVKQEHKDTDGSPELKQKVRQVQTEMAMRRMMQEVPQADVIITNPTHYSVAIRYDQDNMRAPIVVAKGMDLIAFEIRRIGGETGVPMLSAPPLARAIYHTTELDEPIPEGLYMAVAQVLAYIFQLRNGKSRSRARINLNDLPIPDDMHYD